MLKQLLRYSLVPLFLLMAACNNVSTVKNTAEEPHPAEQEVAAIDESSWQESYGETQEPQQNELPAVEEELVVIAPIDLWQRIRQGYGIPDTGLRADTQKQLDWFARHPEYIARVADRAEPYLYHIVEQIEQRNMPLELALLPVVESAYQPHAYSSARAAGLWQFIPSTGRLYGLQQSWWYDGRRDVVASTSSALDYLQKLHDDFGDWQLAVAAYNCGEGRVARAIERNLKAGKATDFWSLDLPRETSAYVPKLMAIAQLIRQPAQYQITLKPIANEPYFTVVDVKGQIDLSVAAELAELEIEQIHQLNPGFNQWATAPDGPHHLAIPVGKTDIFIQGLAVLPAEKKVQWARYKIKSGDSLGKIAQQYKVAVSAIKKANGIKGTNIRAGKYLLIPVAPGKSGIASLPANQRLASKQSTSQKGAQKTYTVKQGDSWWEIAQLYKVSVKKLTMWNNKAPSDYLQPGQKLDVWAQIKTATSNDSVRSVNYKIRSGDSLWTISQKFKVTINDVRQWNDLNKKAILQPGQNLKLFVDVTKQHNSI
ncbi:MAG: LysM peptidoglycan-binding domain-containing protein [Methylophaga sp.]|nr:LysM peptidoglycan-binding domain-containing protein [Methylophaga sp.]